MRLFLAAALAILLAAGPALADDSAVNPEGRWTVGRGDSDALGCLASIRVGETTLIVLVEAGRVDFGLGTKAQMRKGKQGVLTVGDQRFAFAPEYGDRRDLLYIIGVDRQALAAAREARWITVVVDGRELVAADLEATGAANAMDAIVACSEGKSGWWGPGVGAARATAEADAPHGDDPFVYRAEDDVWGIATFDGYCIAQAEGPDSRSLQVLASKGGTGIAIASRGAPLPRSRKVLVETDSYRFEFKAEYSDDGRYVASADPLEISDLLALKRARQFRATAGGRKLLDVEFDADSFFYVVEAAIACARGEKGWWGEGAKPAN